ncbi:uncharacterized protein LOC131077585 [Cryptomeria japonica]|uniref:uncharacterized protein LOC131077585 n=1 Tax=Cryptomeria japonica TaxID=3369 RepID=UPI0027DA31F6|nr:uncharacterized protein LOC131077585 [Cryptomeria japonica]
MAEVLSNLIKSKQSVSHWEGIQVHRLIEPITHSQFADDTILFGEATMKEAKGIKEVLDKYSKLLDQVMNMDKSQIFFFNTERLLQNCISHLLGLKIADLPLKYLGIRINMGCRQSHIWEDVLNSCKIKLEQWKNRWLIQAGRILMIKFVLSAVPIYSMQCFQMPSLVGAKLDGYLKKFVWDRAKEHKKIPLINWDTMCMRKEDGGAGLRKMSLQNLALGAKLSWKMYKSPNKLWCRIFQKKYLDSDDFERIFTIADAYRSSPTWNFL